MQMLGKTPHDSKTKGVHQQASAKGARSSWEQEVTGDCLLPHPMPQTRLEVFSELYERKGTEFESLGRNQLCGCFGLGLLKELGEKKFLLPLTLPFCFSPFGHQ